MDATIERRLFRRAELDAPVVMRLLATEGVSAEPMTGQLKNVSLAGFFCHVPASCPLQPGQQVISSVSIPPEHAQAFPFTRLHGKGWVVRRHPIGLAVAFTSDVTALGTLGRGP